LTPPNDAVKGAIAEAATQILNTPISKKSVRIQNNTAFITGSSIMKNSLQVNRGQILQRLYENLPKARDSIRDVR